MIKGWLSVLMTSFINLSFLLFLEWSSNATSHLVGKKQFFSHLSALLSKHV